MNIFNKFFKRKKVKKSAVDFNPDIYYKVMEALGYSQQSMPMNRKTVVVFEAGKATMIYIDAYAIVERYESNGAKRINVKIDTNPKNAPEREKRVKPIKQEESK